MGHYHDTSPPPPALQSYADSVLHCLHLPRVRNWTLEIGDINHNFSKRPASALLSEMQSNSKWSRQPADGSQEPEQKPIPQIPHLLASDIP